MEFDVALIARTFSVALEEDERHGQAWQKYVPHAISVMDLVACFHSDATENESVQAVQTARATLLSCTAWFYRYSGSYHQAASLLEEAIKVQKARKGVTDTETIVSIERLADVRRIMAHYHEAQRLNEEVIEAKRRFGGPMT